MELQELYQAYKVKKLAFDAAKKEEETAKKALKEAMGAAKVKDYTDEEGYRFECFSSDRKSIDEEKLLTELKARDLKDCISYKEVVDEDAVLQAVEANRLPQAVLSECLNVTPVVTLKLTPPKKAKGKGK